MQSNGHIEINCFIHSFILSSELSELSANRWHIGRPTFNQINWPLKSSDICMNQCKHYTLVGCIVHCFALLIVVIAEESFFCLAIYTFINLANSLHRLEWGSIRSIGSWCIFCGSVGGWQYFAFLLLSLFITDIACSQLALNFCSLSLQLPLNHLARKFNNLMQVGQNCLFSNWLGVRLFVCFFSFFLFWPIVYWLCLLVAWIIYFMQIYNNK